MDELKQTIDPNTKLEMRSAIEEQLELVSQNSTFHKNLKDAGDFITEKLILEWTNDPQTAPGRLVSSPWPDRIEILSMKKLTSSVYEVKGEIIEVTSKEKAEGGVAAKRPITLLVKFTDDLWLIDEVTIEDYEEADSIVYKNE